MTMRLLSFLKNNAMKNPNFGDIIFFKPRSLKSRIINYFDRGPWSHVGLILDLYENRILFIESHWNGVRIGLVDETEFNFEIHSTHQPLQKSKQEILSFVGRLYDYKHLISMGIYLGSQKRIPVWKTDESKLICSELVNWAYGYTLSPKGKATPNSIAQEIKKQARKNPKENQKSHHIF